MYVWRPLIAWSEKFKFETVEAQNSPQSVVLDSLRRSPTLRVFKTRIWKPLGTALGQGVRQTVPNHALTTTPRRSSQLMQWFNWLFISGVALIVLWGLGKRRCC
jgi:NitT/TauT family transport system permease protein